MWSDYLGVSLSVTSLLSSLHSKHHTSINNNSVIVLTQPRHWLVRSLIRYIQNFIATSSSCNKQLPLHSHPIKPITTSASDSLAMTTTLRYIFVADPTIHNISATYTLTTSCKDVKRALHSVWPAQLPPPEYSRVRLIVGGQKMDDLKTLSEYPVCTAGSAPAVHVTVLPSFSENPYGSTVHNDKQKQASCCVIS